MTDNDSSNGWEHYDYDCSGHEDDGHEESSSGDKLDDGDDLEVNAQRHCLSVSYVPKR